MTVKEQELKDKNCLKLGKKITDIIQVKENEWQVLDSDDGGNFGRKVYRTVTVDQDNKIHCEIVCSQFKWERNRQPNCKHVQAVMHLEDKKFKTYIPIEWEILFLESELNSKNTTGNYLKESIMQKQLQLNKIEKYTMDIIKKIKELENA